MKFTGERMIPEYNEGQEIYLEHMTRYVFASQFIIDKIVLDIACGSGYGSNYLLKNGAKNVIGVDISEETINYCKEKYTDDNMEFLVGSVVNIPQKDNSIDIMVSFETIEHVNEDDQIKFLKEIKRVLKKDGVFIVSTPNTFVYPKGNEFHLKELNPEEFNSILKNNFKDIKIFYQDDVECSYINTEDNLKNISKKNEINEKINQISLEDSRYLIAVCSNEKLENIIEYIGLSNINPWIKYEKFNNLINENNNEIKNLHQIIQQKNQEIIIKDNEIQSNILYIEWMKSSRFWKLRTIYLKLRKLCSVGKVVQSRAFSIRMFKKIFINNTDSSYIQFIRYGFVGTIAFLIDFGFLFLFTEYLHIYYLISATLSFLIALTVNYLLSIKWVFKKRTGLSINNELILLMAIALVGLVINDLIMWFLTEKINLFYLISKIVASLIVLFWNFYGRRNLFYKFQNKK